MTTPPTETMLFIGGPADGKRMAMPKGLMRARIPIMEYDVHYALEITDRVPVFVCADYDRSRIALCDGGNDFEFMTHNGLSHRDALQMLSDGYRRG